MPMVKANGRPADTCIVCHINSQSLQYFDVSESNPIYSHQMRKDLWEIELL